MKCYQVRMVREGRPVYTAQLATPGDVVAFFRKKIGSSVQERFLALYLDARHVPLGWTEVSRGTVSASLVHPRELFLPAVQLVASAVILCHNHPSGDCTPSTDDVALTRRLKEAGMLLGFEVLDHLVVTAEEFLSFRERGLI